ncbi:hypothetical protein NI17_022430 [Thermobifida halotolerans]|uniref:Uncharacterized protein n=1 Tax=Thermobifida halotolerans TaxID=483545 RepID=A0AA97LWF6_9ACTN|nr:hypothetical protein [Thermobifida halotolerans]UOE19443.1 hypothetical protein NI17_022430 [Thermobifida halotolerans]
MTDNSREVREEAHSPTTPPGEGASASPPTAPPSTGRPASPRTLRPQPSAEEAVPPPTVDSDVAAESTTDTAVAEETAEEGRPDIDAVGALKAKPLDPVAPTPRPGRPTAPVLAGAAIAGLLLIATPFTVSAGAQGVSLDIVPLSGGGLLGDDPLNGSQDLTELETTPLGSSPTAPPVGGTVPDSGGDGGSGGGGGGNTSAASDPNTGYVPEALDEEPEGFPAETDGTDAEGGTGSGGGTGGQVTRNNPQHRVEYGDGTNIASGPKPSSPKSEETPSADGNRGERDRDDKAGSSDKPETPEDPEGGLDLPLPLGSGGDKPADKEEDAGKDEDKPADADADGNEDGADTESPTEGNRTTASDDQKPTEPTAGQETEREAEREENPAEEAPAEEAPAEEAPAEEAPAEEAPAEETPAEEAPAEEAPWSYTVTAGPGCASDASYGRVGVWHSEGGTSGWANRPSGYTESGCDGTYDAIPVSGSADHGSGEYAYWSFSPGVAGATCELYVHIPNDESPLWIGEQEARYQIFAGPTAEGAPVAGFGIHQSQIRGGWVQATGFVSPTEQFTIQLTNVGENTLAGQGDTSTHVAASVIRTECS